MGYGCCSRPNRARRRPGDQHGFSTLHGARLHDSREGGEVRQSNRSRILVTELWRNFDERRYGDSHEFGMASIPSEAQIASGSEYQLAVPVRIFGDYATSKVTAGNSRQCDLRHSSRDVLHVTLIDCSGNDLLENSPPLGVGTESSSTFRFANEPVFRKMRLFISASNQIS
jgi:hypothetical protein